MSTAYPDDDRPRQHRPTMRPTDDDPEARDFWFSMAPKWRDDAIRRVLALDTPIRPVDPDVTRRALSLIACVEADDIPEPKIYRSTNGGVGITFVGAENGRQAGFVVQPGRPIVQARTVQTPTRRRTWEVPPPSAHFARGGLADWVRNAVDHAHRERPREEMP